MRVLGIQCHVEAGRPVVVGVALDDEHGAPTGGEVLRHVADPSDEPAQQLRSLADHLETELRTHDYAAVIVRAMDYTPRQRAETTRWHYWVEGALISEARRHVELTRNLSGREIGLCCGKDKTSVEDEAASLVGEALKEAGAAALAGLALANG